MKATDNHKMNQKYIDMANDLGLTQVVDFLTHQNATLDLFFTNCPSLVNQSDPQPEVSDHEIVYTDSCVMAKLWKLVKRKSPDFYKYTRKLTRLLLTLWMSTVVNHQLMKCGQR